MKLYYSPGACSLSPHIVLREMGIPFALERVDVSSGKTESGEDFGKINPKRYVPALRLSSGEILTEGAAVVQYIADQNPDAGLAPSYGSIDRARMQEHLNFIASELHKAFGPLFNATASEEAKQAAPAVIASKLEHIEAKFSDGREYLLGDVFSVADAYLFAVASWTKPTGIGLERWPNLAAFLGRVASRPSVRAAMEAEGLAIS